jgi:chemotaxis protein methyltransferase CheR
VYEPSVHNILADRKVVAKLSDETFEQLRSHIYEKLGIWFTDKKKYLLEGRLAKRLQLLNIPNFEAYVQLIKYGRNKEDEFPHLCNAVTINETFFFRNNPQLEALERTVVPAIRQEVKDRPIRIWSAASSSGEEAYSVAMLFLERILPKYPGMKVEVIGTDIAPSVLDAAKKGEYSQYALRNIPDAYLKKYFIPQGERYMLKDQVKQYVRFESLNLVDRQQMKVMRNFDIIFCCNVLMYFDQKAKVQVVGDLYNSLNRNGFLFIGFSELLHGISTAFKVVSFPQTTGYRKE